MFHGGFLCLFYWGQDCCLLWISAYPSLFLYVSIYSNSIYLCISPPALSAYRYLAHPLCNISIHLSISPSLSLNVSLSYLVSSYLTLSYHILCMVFHFVYLHDLTGMYRSGIKLPLYARSFGKEMSESHAMDGCFCLGTLGWLMIMIAIVFYFQAEKQTVPPYLYIYKDVAGTNKATQI